MRAAVRTFLVLSILAFSILAFSRPSAAQSGGERPPLLTTKETSFKMQPTEKAKIQYLLARIGQSPYTFIRNGEEHSGREASSHLRWKYGFAFSRIKTVDEFINYIASRSMKTGEEYRMRISSGEVFEMDEVLYNELEALRDEVHVG